MSAPNPVIPSAQVKRGLTDIIYVVAEHFGVSPSAMFTAGRGYKSVADARNVVYGLARDLTKVGYREVADVFGRDHSTVVTGVQRLAERMKRDELLARSVAVCRARALETMQARRLVP